MAASDLGTPFPEGVLEALATDTWKYIYRDERKSSEMPTRGCLEGALVNGELDDSISELAERLCTVVKADCPIYLWRHVVERHPIQIPDYLIPVSGPHNNIVSTIADEALTLEARRALILASIVKIHGLWHEMLIYNPRLKHPLAPLVTQWFKLNAPHARERPLYYRLWQRLLTRWWAWRRVKGPFNGDV